MDPREHSDRAVQDLLSADAVLPQQFWTCRDGTIRLSGERALMWAVFADGIDCYRRTAHATSTQQRADFAEIESWVLGTDWDWPFSFVNLCQVFGFDPAGVRDALQRWKNRPPERALPRQRFRPVTLHAA